jgi:eukaryotic-like serine/threonine-protein kinase
VAPFERWLEVKRIFEEALEVEPRERPAFLDRACVGDEELRREVEALLSAPALPTSSLASLLGLPDRRDEPDYAEGDRVDHFTIVREVGKGGMGTVYEARDTRNNDRRVAVKVLFSRAVKLSQDKRLAGLSHPSIVVFHDSGETEEGLPYFVFEFIEGEPITEYCERRKIGVPERLRLFQKVCEAVAYAHQRLVIHCDLKPENILVTATGELKLLDFGIAKEVGAAGSAAGEPSPITLPFASPEQVGGEETTTLSDAYSLGVLLTVLLTGRLPYRNARTVAELRDAILYEEPVRPSELVSLSAGAAEDPSLYAAPPAAKSPMGLGRRLRGDLDAIVGKALRKEPASRYQSAADLANDVARHLTGLPVSARSGSRLYRASRFLKRHRGAASVGALIALLVLAFLGLWLRQYRETVRQRDQATREATRAAATTSLLIEMFQLTNPHETFRGATSAKELLDQAVEELPRRLKNEPETEVRLLNSIGEMYQNMGMFKEAARTQERALALATQHLANDDPLLGETLDQVATLRRGEGQFAQAEAIYRRALAVFERGLSKSDPRIGDTLQQLGIMADEQARYDEALKIMRRVLDLRRSAPNPNPEAIAESLGGLGSLLTEMHRPEEAEPILRECLAMRRKIYGEHNPIVADDYSNLAAILQQTGMFEESERLQRKATALFRTALGPQHPRVAISTHNLGLLFLLRGDTKAAVTTFREALAVAEAGLGKEHRSTVKIKVQLALALVAEHEFGEADRLIGEAYAFARKQLEPTDRLMASIVRAQGLSLYEQKNYQGAEAHLRQAVGLLQMRAGASGYVTVSTSAELGSALVRLGRWQEAEPLLLAYYRRAVPVDKPKAVEHVVQLYEASGNREKAAEYRKLLSTRPVAK